MLIDTSGWICFFARRGYPEIKRSFSALLDEDRVATAGPVLVELLQGCRTDAERREIEECLAGVVWLKVDESDWRRAGYLSFSLRRKGVTVSAIDALIATVAISNGCSLLHVDQDYTHIAKHSELSLFTLGRGADLP